MISNLVAVVVAVAAVAVVVVVIVVVVVDAVVVVPTSRSQIVQSKVAVLTTTYCGMDDSNTTATIE